MIEYLLGWKFLPSLSLLIWYWLISRSPQWSGEQNCVNQMSTLELWKLYDSKKQTNSIKTDWPMPMDQSSIGVVILDASWRYWYLINIAVEILDDMWRAADDVGEGLMGGISQLTTGSKVKRNIRCILLFVFLDNMYSTYQYESFFTSGIWWLMKFKYCLTRSLGALLAGGPLGLLTLSFPPFGPSGRYVGPA